MVPAVVDLFKPFECRLFNSKLYIHSSCLKSSFWRENNRKEMAYPAVICLKNTAERLLDSPHISFQYKRCRTFVKRIYSALEDLRDALKQNDKKRRNMIYGSVRVMALETELREAASNLEDSIESQLSTQILSQSESNPIPPVFSIDLREIRGELKCFLLMAERMEEEYLEDDDETVVPQPIYFNGGDTSKMVGLSDIFDFMMDNLVKYPGRKDLSICGMAGIGKTAMVKKLLEDPQMKKKYKCRIFVPIGLEPKVNYEAQFKRILQAILVQVKPDSDVKLIAEVEYLDRSFWKRLNNGKTLIVLDDVWSKRLWPQLRRLIPNKPNGCVMLVTTRTRKAVFDVDGCVNMDMRFMNKEESWDLLCGRVFGEEALIPEELEKAGKKIAENCEGLPLLIIAVANLLASAERTPELWNMVAANKENHIFVNAYDQISEVLLPSYYNLPQKRKPCFLYLRVFPQNHQFRYSRLVKLLSGEDFFDPSPSGQTKHLVYLCLLDFENDSVMLVHRESESHGVREYSLHSGFWYLCKKEAENVKVLHTFNRYADGLSNNIEGQRRLVIYKNVLLGINDFVASVPNARSILCTGAYHQYQVPICFAVLRLLRVLDALTIRFYVFPIEVVQLILLRYLSLTCNDNLSPSISKLWNLQCLIVHKHLNIKFSLVESYLPVEIWDLQELQFLEIMGRNLPDPPPGISLPELLSLLDVDAYSCTKGVLQSVPKLKKLRVQIELAPDAVECLICFDQIPHIPKLKSFQCVIKNPMIVASPPLPIFGSRLKKLTLRGFGYPWKEMNKIAGLPSLKVLKLQCYAFRGANWEAKKGFPKLRRLVIEDTDLVQWTCKKGTFSSLRFLIVQNCYKLQTIPDISTLKEIKMVDCSPAVVTSAKNRQSYLCEVSVSSSWEEEKR